MMFSLYSQKGLANIALVNGIFAFVGFGVSNMIVLHILRKFNLKYGLVIGFSGLLLCEINVMFTIFIADKNIPIFSSVPFLYIINIITTFLTGISNSINWYKNILIFIGQLYQHTFKHIVMIFNHFIKQVI